MPPYKSVITFIGLQKDAIYYVNLIQLLLSFIAVAMNSKDRYEIIGLRENLHFIKQPCRNVCLEKAL